MDVANPIASVIPTLDGPVLGALAGTSNPLTLSETHRLAGTGSLSGVRRVLLRLRDVGLADDVPGGYVLNRDHVAAQAVEALACLHGELATRSREVLASWEGVVLLAGLYGSGARRDGDERSDIDALVVSDSPGLDELVTRLGDQIHRWTGNEAHVVGKTTADIARLRRGNEPILQSWDRDLLVLAGDRRQLRSVA
ncbi:MAG: nucleotidyltransferase domain-containing protein [Acidimicrobiia bacterium]|nr:nucleotidyltransferase domain-containing protein [Acidimicrobiia bacterium]